MQSFGCWERGWQQLAHAIGEFLINVRVCCVCDWSNAAIGKQFPHFRSSFFGIFLLAVYFLLGIIHIPCVHVCECCWRPQNNVYSFYLSLLYRLHLVKKSDLFTIFMVKQHFISIFSVFYSIHQQLVSLCLVFVFPKNSGSIYVLTNQQMVLCLRERICHDKGAGCRIEGIEGYRYGKHRIKNDVRHEMLIKFEFCIWDTEEMTVRAMFEMPRIRIGCELIYR